MRKYTLVILAAGTGSRFGSLKQLSPLSKHHEAIIDFSVYDALKAGFNEVIFIIRKEIEGQFRSAFDHKLEKRISFSYVFQDDHNIPERSKSHGRTKPWGTAHALLALNKFVDNPFLLINGDDFYGRRNFEHAIDLIDDCYKAINIHHMIAFYLKNTLSENGAVSRGECELDSNQDLIKITERTKIQKKGSELFYEENEKQHLIDEANTPVSMNFWIFHPSIFPLLDIAWQEFLRTNSNDLIEEFFIPSAINSFIESGKVKVKVQFSSEKWFGITYKEDEIHARKKIEKMKADGDYPNHLWAN